MGNAASCTPSRVASGGGDVRVIAVDGRVDWYANLVTAAEIMADKPGYFICDSEHLNVGYRIPGLPAQEELERRRLYFLLPMDMLYSVLTDEEMSSLTRSASRAVKRRWGGAATRKIAVGKRIIPVLGDFCSNTTETKKAQEPKRGSGRTGDVVFSWQRSWKPALDTIEEVT